MADRTESDSRHHLSVSPPPRQIPKDVQGSENAIPLSPQWLLPKPGESKPGISAAENNFSVHPTYGNRLDILKSPGNVEEMQEIHKKKDVFRPSLLDMETGRRDRWRDEERDTNSSMRKDRWRDADKELGDSRNRWMENSAMRPPGEVRRTTSDRWSDSSNRDSNYEQRRESKWNTRWGPDDKETDGLREKWFDPSRDGDVHLDKGLAHVGSHGKDEREGDHYRPWRASSLQSRGRGEPPHAQNFTPNKQVSTFSYGRGRGENMPPTFSLGRGRGSYGGSSTNTFSIGTSLDKVDSSHGESYRLKYSRTKLLDVYRMTDMSPHGRLVDGFIQVPYLTQDEPIEPLALCGPNSEEMAVLKGIDKGDVVSSGAPQITKEGRTSTDFMQSRRPKLGSKEDLLHGFDDYKDDSAENSGVNAGNISEGSSYERQTPYHLRDLKSTSDNKFKPKAFREDGDPYGKVEEVPISRESSLPGNISVPASAWRAPSMGEHSHNTMHDWRENSSDGKSRSSTMSWSEPSKELHNEWESKLANLPETKDETKWQTSEDRILKRQPSGVLDREQEARRALPPSPEELVLYYKDPQGRIQGPFSGIDIISWFENGYFGLDLPVSLKPNDMPWSSLGDVMPHLRSKAGPPPGFTFPKQNEYADASSKPNFGSFGKLPNAVNEIDILRKESRQRHGSMTEAENRFLESLMSGNMSSSSLEKFASSEGVQGYIGNNPTSMPPSGVDSGNNFYMMAKRIALERRRSVPNPYPYWPGRDALGAKADVVPEALMPQSKILSSVNDNPSQPLPSHNAELLSLIQGLPDRSSSGLNNGLAGWSNFHVQGGAEPVPNKIDFHQDQGFPPQAPFGMQQRIQPQNLPSLTNPIAQAVDNPSIFTPEKLLSTGLVQDPQLLNMLQQQQLVQLHAQAPVQTQQMSMLDKILLFKQQQQQKQEEQQQLLRQQQQLLSQVLSDHQPHQRFGDPPYGLLQAAAMPTGNPSLDAPRLQPSPEIFQIGSQMPIPVIQDQHNTNFVKLPPQVNLDVNNSVSSEASSSHPPQQLFGNRTHQKTWNATVPEEAADDCQKELLQTSSFVESSNLFEMMSRSVQEPQLVQNSVPDSEFHDRTLEQSSENTFRHDETITAETSEVSTEPVPLSVLSAGTAQNEASLPDHSSELMVQPCVQVSLSENEEQLAEKERCAMENPVVKEVKNVEVREQRKASDKKAKKQKSSKSVSSEQAKEVPKTSSFPQARQSENQKHSIVTDVGAGDALNEIPEKTKDNRGCKSGTATMEHLDSQQVQSFTPAGVVDDTRAVNVRNDLGAHGSTSVQDMHTHTGHRAWKPAPGFKPKSLLEIQQEEQRKAHIETVVSEITTSVNSMSLSTPWAGVLANPDTKVPREHKIDAGNVELSPGKHEPSADWKSKKSHLHDLLAEEVLAKSSERDTEVSDSLPTVATQQAVIINSESVPDDNFIEAKETKKSRKKSAKSKGAGTKVSVSPASDIPIGSSPVEKGKSSRPIPQEKEVIPAIPSGPSLGDFVLWKGESTNSSPSPAWLTESGKLPKPTSLRDIQKEQEKRVFSAHNPNQIPTPQKSQPTQVSRTSGPSWSLSASSPAKSASSIQINSHAAPQSKYKGDDDLFWGPIDQSKQETKQVDFPNLASQSSRVMKSTPVKGTSAGSLSRQKSVGGKAAERVLSSSPASQASLKGKRDSSNNHSEATDFRDWCQSECLRLIGTKDTSFLEFCLKQSRSEAELFLVENLGSYDPDHAFIDKFLNYKELLPADVLEIAFQNRNDQVSGFSTGGANSGNAARAGDVDGDKTNDLDGSSKGGGKRKGKKGKKVSPAVLGFNVVSNRIMMGEIQNVED